MTITAEKADIDLKMDILAELRFEPTVNIADIGVRVRDGVVTLTGQASSYAEKINAVRAVKRVAGVSALADDLEVSLRTLGLHTDGVLAAEAINRINWSALIPPGAVQLTVRMGHVTLEGQVEWCYQKNAAESALHHMAGITGITNEITIKPLATPDQIGIDLRSALRRNVQLDAGEIRAEVTGSHVVLTGKVRSHIEWEEAERLAWAAAGVLSVANRLRIEWSWNNAS
jgi:osmotically-inducible protein OsmY